MHIAEGVLSAPVLATGAVLTAGATVFALRRMDYEQLPGVAILSSVFFVAALIHVPVGPVAAHLVLNGLCGLLLGWLAFPAILVGLTLQAILFNFGGLTTLGLNAFNMAFPAVVVGYACGWGLGSANPAVRTVAEFSAGAGAVLLSGILVACSLVVTGESFQTAAWMVVAAHVPVMVVEGIVTVFIVEFVRRVRPEMLQGYA